MIGNNFVKSILSKAEAKAASLPSTAVERPLDQENDLGNLLGIEYNDIIPSPDEEYLKSRARDNVQLLINDLWKLPTERVDEAIVVQLPPPTTIIPREKPIPKPKPLTKWEQYAKQKGIVNKKKPNLVWDDAVREWVPRFGYKRAQAEVKKTWAMEVKGNAPDNEDPFEKAAEEKREKMAKNELQRLRNIAKTKKVKIPSVSNAVIPKSATDKKSSTELSAAAALAKKSTASLGKFQEKLSGKLEKNVKKVPGKKRKFDPLVSSNEKDRNMKILENLSQKKPKLDLNTATGRQIQEEDRTRSQGKKSMKGSKKGKKVSKGKGRGKAVGKKKASGTKRR